MKWYGQFDPQIDAIAFGYFPNKRNGSAIEVGAVDGVFYSNTKAFEEIGWLCLCIEPNPEYWNDLKRNRKHCQPYAVSSTSGTGKFTVFKGPITTHEAISSLKPDERLVGQYSATAVGELNVPTRTLDDCVSEFGLFKNIDYVSIDTEGTELDVLKGFTIDRWNPGLLVVENNFNEPYISEYLSSKRYRLDRRAGVNDFYVPL